MVNRQKNVGFTLVLSYASRDCGICTLLVNRHAEVAKTANMFDKLPFNVLIRTTHYI